MINYPDVQTKAQKELDGVLGSKHSSLPSLEMIKELPYTEATMNEVLRLGSIAPFSGMKTFGYIAYLI